jgi:hypothetical protein
MAWRRVSLLGHPDLLLQFHHSLLRGLEPRLERLHELHGAAQPAFEAAEHLTRPRTSAPARHLGAR